MSKLRKAENGSASFRFAEPVYTLPSKAFPWRCVRNLEAKTGRLHCVIAHVATQPLGFGKARGETAGRTERPSARPGACLQKAGLRHPLFNPTAFNLLLSWNHAIANPHTRTQTRPHTFINADHEIDPQS